MIDFLTNNFAVFILIVAILGLCIGSFLNVVIYRLPKILHQSWRATCLQLLNITTEPPRPSLSLLKPRSHCPHCHNKIVIWRNIPLLSYILQKGRCAYCRQKISAIYPAVELLTAVVSVAVAYRFGVSGLLIPTLIFAWALIALIFIDISYQLLPDGITLSVLWLGLLVNSLHGFVPLSQAVWGAALGYSIFWLIGWLFHRIRGIEGLGQGDYKLLAMLGAWFGPSMLVVIILLASVLGTLMALLLLMRRKIARETPIPFGPYLAIAGFVILFFGNPISKCYVAFFGG